MGPQQAEDSPVPGTSLVGEEAAGRVSWGHWEGGVWHRSWGLHFHALRTNNDLARVQGLRMCAEKLSKCRGAHKANFNALEPQLLLPKQLLLLALLLLPMLLQLKCHCDNSFLLLVSHTCHLTTRTVLPRAHSTANIENTNIVTPQLLLLLELSALLSPPPRGAHHHHHHLHHAAAAVISIPEVLSFF